jgi:hypothetical protein
MWYMPYLRVRRAVLIYVCVAAGITLVAVALRLWPGAHVTIGDAAEHSYVDVAMLGAGAAALVGGLATVLGLNLAAENEGHLELAWTKPVSREGYALGVFAVDIGAIAACIVFTALCGAIVVDVFSGFQAIAASTGDDLLRTFAFCGLPLLVYAWIAAMSASLKRNRGAVAGLFWPLMLAVGLLQSVRIPAVHVAASALNLINPLSIYTSGAGRLPSLWTFAWGWLIAAILLAAALAQWRRLEL